MRGPSSYPDSSGSPGSWPGLGPETAAAAAAAAVVAAAVAAVAAAVVVVVAVAAAAAAAAAAVSVTARLASFASATAAGWHDSVCSDLGWEACLGHRGFAGTSDKLWAGCRCYGSKRAIAFGDRHQADNLAEVVERCAPPQAAGLVGGWDPCRRKVVGKTPWVNASGECIQGPGMMGKHEVVDLTGRKGARVGHRPHRAVSPAERRPERLTPGQRRPRNSKTQAGICSRSEAYRSWCICR